MYFGTSLTIRALTSYSVQLFEGSGVAGVANLPSLMSKSAIRANLTTLSEDIGSVKSRGLDFIMG